MNKTKLTAVMVLLVLIAFCVTFPLTTLIDQGQKISPAGVFQQDLDASADPSIGPKEMPDDGSVDVENFATHLPLVVIDTNGKEIPNIVEVNDIGGKMVRDYIDPNNTEEWEDMTLTVIDRDDHINTLSSEATFVNHGKIKLRGTSSRAFLKKQYGIKLLDEKGNELKYPMMGMQPDEKWVLSNSVLDSSGIRNYVALSIASEIFPYVSDNRFCEVMMKDGDTYTYQGLYLMSESIKQGKNRVAINDYKSNPRNLSYIIRRDRLDKTGVAIPTWGSDKQICYGWYSLIYPRIQNVTNPEETIEAISEEISTIEKILYSDDYKEFSKYKRYIDVNSFVDYFILNEYFGSYDNNSTYYYKDNSHKLSMGLAWDYDNAMDNYIEAMTNTEYMAMTDQPWMEMLLKDPEFVEKICDRYKRLRKSVLSDENVNRFIDSTVRFVGNAKKRDWARWRSTYEDLYMLNECADADGFVINRNRDSLDDEIVRMKDTLSVHSLWMDENMHDVLKKHEVTTIEKERIDDYSIMAIVLVVVFITMAALANRATRE